MICICDLYDSGNDSALDLVNSHTHFVNSGIILLDLVVGAIPIRLLLFYIPLLTTLTYVLFNAIYTILGGRDKQGKLVYLTMDWVNTPMDALLQGLALLAGSLGVWLFLYGVYWARKGLANAWGQSKESGGQDPKEVLNVLSTSGRVYTLEADGNNITKIQV